MKTQIKASINYSVNRHSFGLVEFKRFNDFNISTLSRIFGGLQYGTQLGVWSSNGDKTNEAKYIDLTFESGTKIEFVSTWNKDEVLKAIKETLTNAKKYFPVSVEWVNIELNEVICNHIKI